MDKKLKNSLLFGAAAGGLFALVRNAGEKQKLTSTQLQAVNELNEAFVKSQTALLQDVSFAPIYATIKELEADKKYDEIVSEIESNVQTIAEHLGLVKTFKSKLQYVLSGRFTEQRNNPKAHQAQTFFLQIKELPGLVVLLLEKRTQILRLMQKVFRYIKAGESADFKANDTALLQTYMSEFSALGKQVESLLRECKPYQ